MDVGKEVLNHYKFECALYTQTLTCYILSNYLSVVVDICIIYYG